MIHIIRFTLGFLIGMSGSTAYHAFFTLGFLIGMSGSTAYHAFNSDYKKTGIALMVFGYVLSFFTGVLIGMGRLS